MISNRIARWRLIVEDYLRFHPLVRSTVARLIDIREPAAPDRPATELARSIDRLGRAARLTPSHRHRRRLELRMKNLTLKLERDAIEWDGVAEDIELPVIRKGIILKAPVDDGERGVLLIAFEQHWMRLFRYADIEKLAKDYHLIVAPTWSPPHDLPIMLASRFWPNGIIHLLSNLDDERVFGRLLGNNTAVPLLSSSWVHPELFNTEEPVTKIFDIVMLANFAGYKRHFAFFRLLRKLPPTTQVLLLGRRLRERTEETIMYEAALAGVADRITIRQNLPDRDMVRALRSAKVHVIYSKNEGSCVAVAESMFADVPVALLKGANIGSRAWINEHTGRFLSDRHAARELAKMIEEYQTFSPRKWALAQGIDCHGSTAKLNESLKRFVKERGERWTVDIVPHTWRPNPSYLRSADVARLGPLVERFEQDYGVQLQLNRIQAE